MSDTKLTGPDLAEATPQERIEYLEQHIHMICIKREADIDKNYALSKRNEELELQIKELKGIIEIAKAHRIKTNDRRDQRIKELRAAITEIRFDRSLSRENGCRNINSICDAALEGGE